LFIKYLIVPLAYYSHGYN